ncbi:MAG: hypothetical protein HYY93_06090 [Planctomycetes bacterium]|nr:hypothetical protein [Planctomycetota bacterium]
MRWIAACLFALGLASLLGCAHDYHRSCRANHGCVGHTVYECPRHADATSDRPGICSTCRHPLVGSCKEDRGPACVQCGNAKADGPGGRACGGKCEGDCGEKCGGKGESKGEAKEECEGGCDERACPGARDGLCGKCTGDAAHKCCGKCAKGDQ